MRLSILPATEKYRHSVLLMWTDSNLNRAKQNYEYIKDRFSSDVSDVVFHNTLDECVDDLTDINDQQVFLITSENDAQILVPKIYRITHLIGIYIFRYYPSETNPWFHSWPKIHNAYTDIIQLGDNLEDAIEKSKHDCMPFSIISLNNDINNIDGKFIFTRLLMDIFIQIHEETNSKPLFKSAIQQYIRDNATYQRVNKCLRFLDIDEIFQWRCFISDLYHQIKHLHKTQLGLQQSKEQTLIVYRGQRLSIADFERLQRAKTDLLAFNSFVSTSRRKEIALSYAESATACPDLCGILFTLTFNPSMDTIAYADIKCTDIHQNENEILFLPHTSFRIGKLSEIDRANRIFQVELTHMKSDVEVIVLLNRHYKDILHSSQALERLRAIDDVETQFIQLFQITLEQLMSNYPKSIGFAHALPSWLNVIIDLIRKILPDKYELLIQPYKKSLIGDDKKPTLTQPDSLVIKSNF